ncbi:MAG TPA: hypothetical protein IAA98_01990 [Candidatus Avipropionibacterium avicola]|uniref:Bifunctional glucose-6-phosphate/mannose-6-phosphate isomerase C-terminal domain-containing protein n=1 Tax=Candidatus Avipropionibacterium avicola TaxID=2840701 RepID=A0A9D1KL79_9ACTN|nr:hypothetical protein [Candidatus Avipropionibacterium avicola]
MSSFDDSRLDDPEALLVADAHLRFLAEAGGRVRVEWDSARLAVEGLGAEGRPPEDRPRAVVAVGPDARLIRALLEPVCPVPFMAWPTAGLPGWVGPLDLVVVLAPERAGADLVATAREAVRRGAQLVVACGDTSPLVDHAGGSATTFLTTRTRDNLATVVVVAAALHRLGLGPRIDPEAVAQALDDVAVTCSPHVDLASNPGKEFALATAEAQTLLWGGSTLASRASRRVAEALREVTGRPALSADAAALLPVIESAASRDVFADPFLDGSSDRPVLVVMDDGVDEAWIRADRGELLAAAERRDVRVVEFGCDEVSGPGGGDLARYASLRQRGMYGAAYLALGLGRLRPVSDRSV